jgi:hypothetical protein
MFNGAKIHSDLPAGIRTVADAENDDVAFVSLDVFQVLYQEPDMLAINFSL